MAISFINFDALTIFVFRLLIWWGIFVLTALCFATFDLPTGRMCCTCRGEVAGALVCSPPVGRHGSLCLRWWCEFVAARLRCGVFAVGLP